MHSPQPSSTPRPCAQRPCRAPSYASLLCAQFVLRYKLPLLPLPSGHNTLGVLQYTSLPFKQLQSRYNVCIVTQPAFLANLPLLQYTFLPGCNTIPTHFTLSCNTIFFLQYNWVVAYFKFLHQFFFFIFHYRYIFFPIISSSWKNH